ncbi:MAG: hypothetical protein ABI960_07225 [Candidatus Eisenbacteria bacterium]
MRSSLPRVRSSRAPRSSLAALLVALLAAGCARSPVSIALPNLLPVVQLTAAPRPGGETTFQVHLSWSAFDPDGQVERFVYAVDPPVGGDTTWTTTVEHELTLTLPATIPADPLAPPGQRVLARDTHTFVLRAVDNLDGRSPVVARSFTAHTVAPETLIQTPTPNGQQPVQTLTQLILRWQGTDPDGITRNTPVLYKYRLVPGTAIKTDIESGLSNAEVQEFFGRDRVNGYAGWDSTADLAPSYTATGLTAGRVYVFAVVSKDEAGAWEPRFLLDANTLRFKPTLQNLGPRITVESDFFSRTQSTGGISLDASRISTLEIPPGTPLRFQWSAVPNSGSSIAGYRWSVDIAGGNIDDETAREDDSDLRHWSSWSLSEQSATIGPFTGSVDSTVNHFLFVEARDQVGFVSLFTLRLSVIVARLDRPLLVIDDMYGTPGTGTSTPYPTEAEQDTFHFAVGGVPDRLAGGISSPGAFADFAYDTLDYRFFGRAGIPLSTLGRYRVVAWYTDNSSSSGTSDFVFGSGKPSNALRYVNATGHLNTLAVYLRQGGKAFLFGDGVPPSIANGYWSRNGTFSVPFIPYSSSPLIARQYVLRPGCFLWDYLHLRSELNTAGTASVQFTKGEQLRGAIPYLPEFAGPGSSLDRSHDPRIGPAAERNLATWEGLPRFTLRGYRGANADPAQRSVNLTWYVSRPLAITEGVGLAQVSVLDTLYLLQARNYTGDGTSGTNSSFSDGLPNAVYYHGSEHGPVVWFGFPLYYFELDQARQAVSTVLRVLGVPPRGAADPPGAGVARAGR